jgi:hypothetical protein
VKAAIRVGLLDRSESRVLGSAVIVGSVVAVVINMVAGLFEGVVVLGGSAVVPAGDGAIMEVSLVLGGGGQRWSRCKSWEGVWWWSRRIQRTSEWIKLN